MSVTIIVGIAYAPEAAAQGDPAAEEPAAEEPAAEEPAAEEPADTAPLEEPATADPAPEPPATSVPEEPAAVDPAPAQPETAPVPAAPEDPDGVRFRGGVSAGGGGLLVSGFAVGLGGLDGRIGVQIMDLIGVYVQPHLAFGGGTFEDQAGNSLDVITGTAGASLLVDFTFIDQIFVGAGGGVSFLGQLNEPAPEFHARVGGYPVMGYGEDGIRRKGLMVGIDLRAYFVNVLDVSYNVVEPMLSIGYEAF